MSLAPDRTRSRLWAEFSALFVLAPLVMALFVEPERVFAGLFSVTAIGLLLLHVTPGHSWRALLRGWGELDWRSVGLLAFAVAGVSLGVMLLRAPEALFMPGREQPLLLLMIFLLYPLVSALPQELLFRVLFFRRYGALFSSQKQAIMVNALLFSLAHLMYWDAIVALMTFAGGLVFAWAYEIRRSFALAVVMHGLAGNILFAIGMGLYFYSGNVERPF